MINKFFKKRVVDFQPYLPNEFEGYIKLDANESPYNLNKNIKNRVLERFGDMDFTQYPDSNSDRLRRLISEYIEVPFNNIVVGNGSDEMIHVLLNTFVEMGDVVISHDPTFTMYELNTKVLGGEYVKVPTNEKFDVDVDSLIDEANRLKAKIVFLCNPNNPTGNITKKSEILRLIEETDSIVVVDEAYIDFGGESVIKEVINNDRLIVLRTFSKAFGGAAIRTGYLVSSEEIAMKIIAIKSPYNLNVMSQIVAEELVSQNNYMIDNVKEIIGEKKKLYKELDNIEGVYPYESFANFILFKVDDAVYVFNELKKKGILIRLFKGGVLENHLRVSVGTQEDNIKFINALKSIFY